MKRFAELSVRKQVLCLLMFTFAAVLAAVAVIFMAFSNSQDQIEQLRDEALVEQRLIKDISDFYAIDVVDTTVRIDNGLISPEAAIQLLTGKRVRTAEYWAVLGSTAQESTDRQLLATVLPNRRIADAATDKLIALLEKEDAAGVKRFLVSELFSSIDPITAALQQMIVLQGEEVDQILESHQQDTSTARLFTIGMMTFGFTLIGIMGMAMVSGVANGVANLSSFANALQSGKLETRLLEKPTGELALLADGLESMRDAVSAQQAELLKKTADLGQQSEFLQTLIDTLPYPVFYKGPDTRFRGFNKAYEDAFSVKRTELIGLRVMDLEYLPEEDRQQYQEEDERCIRDAVSVVKEIAMPFADGEMHHTLYSVAGFHQTDGSPGGLVGSFIDISERKAAEAEANQARRDAEAISQRITDITDNVPGVVFEYKMAPDGTVTAPLLGLGIERLVGISRQYTSDDVQSFFAALLPDDLGSYEEAIQNSARNKSSVDHVFRIRHQRSRELRWLRVTSGPPIKRGDSLYWRGYIDDVTQIKRLEQESQSAKDAAEASRRRVLDIADRVPGYVYELVRDVDGREFVPFVSEGVLEITGISRETMTGDLSSYLALIVEEDLPDYVDAMKQAETQGEELLHSLRIKHATSGQIRWLQLRSSAPESDEGRTLWRGHVIDITEEKRLLSELADARQRLIDITNDIPGVFYEFELAADGSSRANFVSAGIESQSGVTAEAGLKDTNAFFAVIHEDDLGPYQHEIARCLAAREPLDYDYRIRHAKTGEIRWINGRSGTPRKVGDRMQIRGFNVDVTEVKELENQLASTQRDAEFARQQVVDITDNIPGVVFEFVQHPEGHYTAPFISGGTVETLGLSSESILDSMDGYFAQVNPQDLPGYVAVVDRSIVENREVDHAVRFTHAKSGEERWIRVRSAAPVKREGLVSWRGYIIDITETKRLETQLLKAREEAESAAQAKGDFLANMSHEIRTPMNAVIGLAHLALKTELNPRQRDYLNKIHNSGQSLLGIINDILDFSKIEAGKLSIEHIDFSLDDVLDNVASMLSQRAVDKGVEFILSRSPEIPAQLVGDPLRLGQILINLAGNAIKFTERGEVEIIVEPRPHRGTGVMLYFGVRDTGIGLTDSQRERLFQSFAQADSSTTRKYGGTGLGLAISKQLTQMMEGDIGVDSEHGHGSTFWFTAKFQASRNSARQSQAAPESLRDLRVMIVDDNPTARDILGRHVKAMGFRYAEASSGERALSLLREADHPFRMILLDWKMDGMDGIAAARKIRELPNYDDVRIIMVSAYGREEVMQRADEAGIDGFLLKPVNPSLLLDAILQALGETSASDSATSHARDSAIKGSLAGKRVLVVEDNEINRQIARELLEEADMTVDEAENGQQCLDALFATDELLYDIVLMDMQMPVMDGMEATRHLRSAERLAHLPIIAMTANAMEQDRQRCLDAGMNDHLSKPIDVAQMFTTLQHWLATPDQSGAGPEHLAASDTPTLPPLPGVDHEQGLLRVGNNPKRLIKAWQRFEQTQADALERMQAAGKNADWEQATREAHTLKGLAATLGADTLANTLAQLEQAFRGQAPDWLMLLDRAREEFEPLIAALPAMRGSTPTSELDKDSVDPDKIRKLIEQLAEQLEDDDTQAVRTLDALQMLLGEDAADGSLQSIREAIDDYDFEMALEPLTKLREALLSRAGDGASP